jgi:DnaD/phage-associated family protein
MGKQTIIRTPKELDRRHFSMERAVPQNRKLSWEARGILCYLLSQPSDWEVRVDDLRQGCGRDKVYKILTELQKAGYLTRERHQKPDGRYEWGPYTVYECPLPEKPEMGLSEEKPFPENPYTDLPDTVDQEINTQILSREEESVKKTTTTEPPLVVVVDPASMDASLSDELTPEEQANGKVFDAYHANIGMLTPMLADKIKLAIEEYERDWIIEAIGIAVEQNRRAWSYVEGVLKNWKRDGKQAQKGGKIIKLGVNVNDAFLTPEELAAMTPSPTAYMREKKVANGPA